MTDDETRIHPRAARQGFLDRPILVVLVLSLVLAGFYLVGMMMWGSTQVPDNPAGASGGDIQRRQEAPVVQPPPVPQGVPPDQVTPVPPPQRTPPAPSGG